MNKLKTYYCILTFDLYSSLNEEILKKMDYFLKQSKFNFIRTFSDSYNLTYESTEEITEQDLITFKEYIEEYFEEFINSSYNIEEFSNKIKNVDINLRISNHFNIDNIKIGIASS